uniref:Uncharacterized protein n=1 Tax=Sinorhizobium sp. M14 TaxID=430451 RepID=R4IL76_9HYPH|nr:hypothetical protein [Sinorhizobium sp. M14]
MRWRPGPGPIFHDQPARGPLAGCGRSWLCHRGDRARPRAFLEPSSGIGPLPDGAFEMSHDLVLAQSHAFQLSRDLMVPVTVFEVDGEYGVYLNSQAVSLAFR